MIKTHRISGLLISFFIGLHLFNHCWSILGADKHIELMTTLRHLYRNIFVEAILFIAIATQVYSGIKLFRENRKLAKSFFDKLHIWTGFYLAIFFTIHLGAVLGGRYILKLDTNFYFGVVGINSFPFNLFFIPYYGIAIFSFFGHIASIHIKKVKRNFLGLTPNYQAKTILIIGACIMFFIFYGLTNHFKGVTIPIEYKILVGK